MSLNWAAPFAPIAAPLVLQPVRGVIETSPKFINEVLTAEQLHVISCAEVWAGDVRTATFMIDPSGSSFTVDRASPARRSGSMVLTEGQAWADDGSNVSVVPGTPRDAFLPYGSQLVLYSGLAYDDGTQELIQMGIGPMEDVLIDDTEANLAVTLNWFDRSKDISRAGFINNTALPVGIEIGAAIQQLFANLNLPYALTYHFQNSGFLTPAGGQIFVPGDDPMQAAIDLAHTAGYELYFDAAGTLCFLPLPNQTQTAPSMSYVEGEQNTAIEVNRTISRANAPNYVIRAGTGTGTSYATYTSGIVLTAPPIQSQFPHGVDVNPASPTYYRGTYGRQVDYVASSLITTQAQANAMADADLLKALGTIDGIQLTAFPIPDTDVDDVVLVTRTRQRLFSVPYVVDSFQMTFGSAGTNVVTARAVSSPVA